MIIVTESPIDPVKIFELLDKNNSGSALFHYAVVKNQAGDRQTSGIRFENNGDITYELAMIETDIRGRWNINGLLLVRRTGILQVGDLISLVAVSAPASSDAFEACRYGLDRIRKMTSIQKTELYND